MSEDYIYEEAKKRVKEKKGFYGHLTAYLAVNVVMFFVVYINAGEFGWLIPAAFWGIGLIIHYVGVFGFPGTDKVGSKEWEAKQIQKEMEKLGGTSEDIPDDELELKQLERLKNKLDDSEFV